MTPLRCRLGHCKRWEPLDEYSTSWDGWCVLWVNEYCTGCGAKRQRVLDTWTV